MNDYQVFLIISILFNIFLIGYIIISSVRGSVGFLDVPDAPPMPKETSERCKYYAYTVEYFQPVCSKNNQNIIPVKCEGLKYSRKCILYVPLRVP